MNLTPLLLTYNEAPNIGRTLARLTWAKQIIVVDSFSTDETEAICRQHPQVQFLQRKFDDHTSQWNFGLDQIKTEWVLSLDADYVLPETFPAELNALHPSSETAAYYARFRYCILGRPLRATLYPPRAVLFRPARCRYIIDGHTQLLQVNGKTEFLQGTIDHDDRKSLARWFREQCRYAEIEAAHLSQVSGLSPQVSFPDRLRRKIVIAPFAVFFYTLIGKGLILDGWPGWFYVFQRTLAELILSLRLLEEKLTTRPRTTDHGPRDH